METESDWVSLFFDEEHIVQTFQLLLIRGNLTMGELHNLCVVAHESSLVLAFTSEGLTPFDSHREYIIPFANMSTCQLQYLRRKCREFGQDDMMHDYGIDFYIVIFDYAGQGRRGPAGLGQECGGVDRRKTRCKGARVDGAGPGEGAGAHRDGPEEWQT